MSKFNHMFDVAFTVISDKVDGTKISSAELIKALKTRVLTLEAMTNEDERLEAFRLCDTFEMEDVI